MVIGRDHHAAVNTLVLAYVGDSPAAVAVHLFQEPFVSRLTG
jgi:hypothetical protein